MIFFLHSKPIKCLAALIMLPPDMFFCFLCKTHNVVGRSDEVTARHDHFFGLLKLNKLSATIITFPPDMITCLPYKTYHVVCRPGKVAPDMIIFWRSKRSTLIMLPHGRIFCLPCKTHLFVGLHKNVAARNDNSPALQDSSPCRLPRQRCRPI